MARARFDLKARSSPRRCVVCRGDVTRTTPATCDDCGVVAHRGCSRGFERCPTLGCAGSLAAEPLEPPPAARTTTGAAAARAALYVATLGLGIVLGRWIAPRWAATRAPAAVTTSSTPAATPARTLLELLRDADPTVRGDAAVTLGEALRSRALPDATAHQVVRALLERCAHDAQGVRTRADAALDAGAHVAFDVLLEAVTDRDTHVRLAAVDAHGRRGLFWNLRRSLDPIAEPVAEVRALALARLSECARLEPTAPALVREIVAALTARQHDPAPLVAAVAHLGLLEQRVHDEGPWVGPSVDALLDAAVSTPERTAAACRTLLAAVAERPAVCTALLSALRDPAPARRALAATVLAPCTTALSDRYSYDREGADAVRAALLAACDDPDPTVQAAARSALATDGSLTRRPRHFHSYCRAILETKDEDAPAHALR